jgi:hypothetical protein
MGGSREKIPLSTKKYISRLSLDGFENAFSNPSANTFTAVMYGVMACSAPVISFLSVSGAACGGLNIGYFQPRACPNG